MLLVSVKLLSFKQLEMSDYRKQSEKIIASESCSKWEPPFVSLKPKVAIEKCFHVICGVYSLQLDPNVKIN